MDLINKLKNFFQKKSKKNNNSCQQQNLTNENITYSENKFRNNVIDKEYENNFSNNSKNIKIIDNDNTSINAFNDTNPPFWIEDDNIIYTIDESKNQTNKNLGGVNIKSNNFKHPLTPTFLQKIMEHYKWFPQKYIDLKQKLFNEINFAKDKNIENDKLIARAKKKKTCILMWKKRCDKFPSTCQIIKDYKKIIILTLAGQVNNWVETFNKTKRLDVFTTYNIDNLWKNLFPPSENSSIIGAAGDLLAFYNIDLSEKRKDFYNHLNTLESYVLIVNAETLIKDLTKFNDFIFKDLDYLVIDEIQYYAGNLYDPWKNRSRLKLGITKLRNQSKYCLSVTGTYISSKTTDILLFFYIVFDSKKFSKFYIEEVYFNEKWYDSLSISVPTSIKKEKLKDWDEFLNLWFFREKP